MALYISADEARQMLSVSDSISLAEEAYRLYGVERNVLSNPAAAFTIVQNDVPTMFWAKAAAMTSIGVAGCFFGAQFGDYYFNLHDCKTGTLLGIVEQAWLVKRRTAVTGVAAAKQLARPNSRIATLIGAGQIGEEVARALPHAFQLDEFRVVSRTFEGASRFAERLAPDMLCPIKAYESAQEAVATADIVITITLADKPVLKQGWIKLGTMVCSMGGVHEIEFGVLSEIDRLVVDDLDSALLRGDLAWWVDRGETTREEIISRVDADIGQIMIGAKPGRASDSESVLAVIQGMASCDLVVAKFLVDKATELGLGSPIAVKPQMTVPPAEKLDARATSIAGGLNRRRQRASVA